MGGAMLIDTELEEWSGSPTVRYVEDRYERLPAARFRDAPARLSERQVVFYRNLIAIALATGTNSIPVDFEDRAGHRRYLDRGCIKIAEHAGFIQPLNNDNAGVVSRIE